MPTVKEGETYYKELLGTGLFMNYHTQFIDQCFHRLFFNRLTIRRLEKSSSSKKPINYVEYEPPTMITRKRKNRLGKRENARTKYNEYSDIRKILLTGVLKEDFLKEC